METFLCFDFKARKLYVSINIVFEEYNVDQQNISSTW